MQKQIGMVLLAVVAVGCGKKNNTSQDSLTGGGAKKVNMAKGSGLVAAGTLKDLELSGDQVNVNIQSIKNGSMFLTYLCDIRSFSLSPSLLLSGTVVDIDFKDASQVNCAMAAPDGAKIIVSDARQANIHLIGAGTSIEVTTNAQANVTLAVQPGTLYSFDVTGLQVNGLATCNAYRTGSATAPSVVVRAAAQANVVCVDIGQAEWENPILTDPDGIAAKALNGSLL